MNKLLSVVAALALVAAVETRVRADDEQDKNVLERGVDATGSGIKKGAEATGDAIKEGAEATGDVIKKGAQATGSALGITDSDQEKYAANARGQRQIKGTVTAIDRDTGKVDFKTASGPLQLHFPTDDLKDVEVGTPLTLVLAFATPDNLTEEDTKPSREVAGDQPLHGDHWMKGTVTDVNAKTGMVGVKTDDMPLTLQFDPDAVSVLKPGDNIAVQIAYEPAAASKSSSKSSGY
jgi:hypothetical protein